MDREVQYCCIGTIKNKEREYHKLTIVTSKTMILFTSLKDKEKILFRIDLLEQKDEVVTVCGHNKALILDR